MGLGESALIQLTAKERILLHLFDYVKYAEAVEVPLAMTQEGIAGAAEIDVPHFTQYVRPLVREGLVRERMAHVKGIPRRRKVYDLTEAGRMQAVRLREKVRDEVVRVRDATGIREATVAQVLREASDRISLLEVVRQATEAGVVDLLATVAPPHGFVEMLADAPKLQRFVGRQAELEAVTKEGEGPRVFVVRGVAGIGKSSFGAKATELLRGKRNLFWHRIRPWDTTSSILANVGDFLSALGKPGLRSVLTRRETSRAAEVLREDLPGSKAFLVFDDAHEATEEAMAFFRALKEALERAPDARALILARQTVSFYDVRDVVMAGLVAEIDLSGLDSQDVKALASSEPDAPKLVEVGRKLGGHPLFLELVRAQRAAPAEAHRDVHRFIREEIYGKLSGDERIVMKTASLYGVPVPRDALFPTPEVSYDVLFSLSDRSLIRTVGADRFEVHDSIRDFFAALLTPSEQQKVGEFAVGQLRRYASEARDARRFVTCIGFLSNALQLSNSPAERQALWEALGDASERIRDFPSTEKAFRESMAVAREPEVLARLHRKLARAYADWGEPIAAAAEAEAGLQVLGEAFSVERGWLNLALSNVAWSRDEIREVQDHAEVALRIFQEMGETSGQAHALATLAGVASRQGTRTLNGRPLADEYYEAALKLADPARDPVFVAEVHLGMVGRIGNRSGDVAKMAEHVRAVEGMAHAMEDPLFRAGFLVSRGWVRHFYQANFSGAASDFEEGLQLARQIRNAGMAAEAEGMLAMVAYAGGRIGEARERFEQTLPEDIRAGNIVNAIANILYAAECSLAEGDATGFRRIAATLEDPRLSSSQPDMHMHADIIRAFESLIDGNDANSRTLFEDAVRIAENVPEEAWTRARGVGKAHLLYSVALRVMGRRREAEAHMKRALEGWGAANLQAFLSTAPERARRLAEGLRRIRSTRLA